MKPRKSKELYDAKPSVFFPPKNEVDKSVLVFDMDQTLVSEVTKEQMSSCSYIQQPEQIISIEYKGKKDTIICSLVHWN